MSELKAKHVVDVYDAYSSNPYNEAQVYIKSEADKVIADLEDDCSYWKTMAQKNASDNAVMARQRAEAFERESHHKYKRCLAMAKWCKDNAAAIKNGYIVSSIESRDGVMTTCPPECNPKFSFYSKWRQRWLDIAEKFKEGV